MKKILLIILLINVFLLTGCAPIIQGISTITTVATIDNDRRSVGTIVDDKLIAVKLMDWYTQDSQLDDAHLNFMVYNKTVLVTGEVPNEDVRAHVTNEIRSKLLKVTKVFNELVIAPNSSILSRTKDTIATTNVEILFQNQEVFNPTHVLVMTENQVVYLMGSVIKREADKAAKVATKAKFVKKVVKLFNYLKTKPTAEIERDKKRAQKEKKAKELKVLKEQLKAKKIQLKKQLKELGVADY